MAVLMAQVTVEDLVILVKAPALVVPTLLAVLITVLIVPPKLLEVRALLVALELLVMIVLMARVTEEDLVILVKPLVLVIPTALLGPALLVAPFPTKNRRYVSTDWLLRCKLLCRPLGRHYVINYVEN